MPKFSRKNNPKEKLILNNQDNVLVAKTDTHSLSVFSNNTISQNPKYEKEVKSEYLISHYKLDEGSGNTATDSGLLGNNATINGATWTTNTYGQNVLSFDGTNDHISITASNIDGYFHQKSFSVCVWVKFDNSTHSVNEHVFTIFKANSTNQHLHLGWESSKKIRIGFYGNDMDTGDNYSSIVKPQSWNHLSFVIDLENENLSSNITNSIRTIYINGVKIKSASVGGNILNLHGASACYIGRFGASDYLSGDLSDLRLYSCPLDQNDIISIYKKTSQRYFDFRQLLSSNLVCRLKLNEGTGTTANDTSSNSNAGTLVNNTTWETGPFGGACAKFDGADDVITLHANSYAVRNFFHNTSFSISMWVKIANSQGSEQFFFSVSQASVTRQSLHVGRLSNNKITFRFYADDFDTTSTTITDNNWHHYVFTYNTSGNNRVIYIDGSSDTTNTAGGSLSVSTAQHIKLGTSYDNNQDLNGSMYDLRIYNKALDDEEVGSIYHNSISKDLQKIKQSGDPALNSKLYSSQIGFCDHQGHVISKTLPVAYENLMLHWELDEGNGYIVFDSSGNGINGYAYVHEGTAQAGTSGSITLDTNANASDDAYNEFYVTITGGTGVTDELRRITDYTGSSKKATVSPNWTTTPSSDTTFNIRVPTESYESNTGWISSDGPNVGPCFNFDGSKQYITTGDINTGQNGLNVTQGLTVCCWVKSETENWSGNACLISKKNGFVLSPSNGKKEIEMVIYDSAEETPSQSSGIIEPDYVNVWHHYTGTYDGNTLRIYLDGGKQTNTNTSAGYSIENDSGPLLIGEDDSTDSNRYFNGGICDVRVYNRALNIDEISKIYHEKALYLQQNIYSPNYLEHYLTSDFINKYGLVFHLTGQDNTTSGYVYDYSGNLHNGTITATVNYSNTSANLCVVGSSNSLYFDGNSGFITLDGAQPSATACKPFKGLGGSSPRTFCCWLKISNLNANNGIFGMGGDGNYEYFNIYIDSSEKINVSTKDANVRFSTALSTSNKQHIAIIYESINNTNSLITGIKCFINGTEIFIESTTNPDKEMSTNSYTNNVFIGKITDTNNSDQAAYFKGNMDDIRLYNRALSYGEIQLIYNGGDGSYTQLSPYSDTLAIFNMTEGTGTTIYNSSGNNTNITLSGVSWNTSEAKTGLNCLDFDGGNDYASFPTVGSNQNNITLSTWINLDTIGDNEVIIGSKASSGSLASGDFQLKLNSITGTNDSKRSLVPHSENNLVGHWKLNDSNGAIMYDSSKYHNHGLTSNDTSLGAHGSIDGISVADFDGTDDTIELPKSVRGFFHDTSFSLSMWVKIAAGMFSGAEIMFFSVGTESINNKNLHIGKRNTNKILFGFYGTSFETTDTITDTDWHHYGFTFNSSNYKLTTYIDGSESANYTHNATLDVDETTHIKIGTKYNNISDLNGSMYDFRIYNKELTSQEVSDIYNSTYFQIDALVTNASTSTITSSKYLSASMWHHVTFVYVNNQYMEIYINGECEAKTLLTTDIPLNFTNTLTIGAQDLNGTLSAYMDGKMSDLRIYSKTLTSSEIKQIYYASLETIMKVKTYNSRTSSQDASLIDLSNKLITTNTSQIAESNIDSNWADFNNVSYDGTTWHDSSGNSYDATIGGSGITLEEEDDILYLKGTTATTITWPVDVPPGTNSIYTLITVARYDPQTSNKERIFDGTLVNYLHGFWRNGNSYTRRLYANNWISQGSPDYDENLEWLISIESANWSGTTTYIYNSNLLNSWNTVSGSPGAHNSSMQLTINNGLLSGSEKSDWNVAEVIVYSSQYSSSSDEITSLKSYLEKKYLNKNKQRNLPLPVLSDLVGHYKLDRSSGPIDKSIVFNGSSSNLEINSASYLGSTTHKKFTISGWIRPSSRSSGTNNIIFSKYHTSTAANKYYKITYDDTNSEIDFTVYAGLDYTLTSKIIQDEWSHVACVCEGSGKQILLYINGNLIIQELIGTISNTNAQTLYYGYDGATNYYLGEMCDFQFHESDLSHQNIIDMMYKGYSSKILNNSINNTNHEALLRNGLKVHFTSHAYNTTTIYDISGNSNDGILNNNSVLSSIGKYGQGISFDGTDDHIDLVGTTIKRYLNSFTISFWAKTNNTSDINDVFYAESGTTTDTKLYISIRDGDFYSQSWSQRVILFSWFGSDFQVHVKPDTNWNHIVCAYDESTRKRAVYYNGKQMDNRNKDMATDAGTSYTITKNLDLSILDTICHISHSSDSFNGYLDDFRIYNRALPAEEAALLYNNTSKTFLSAAINPSSLKNIYTSSYNLNNTNKSSMPIPEIARDNLVMYYDFTDVSSNTINSSHRKFLPNNLYNNPNLIDVDGINKKIRVTNFSSTKSGATIVDCPLANITKCAQFDGSNDYIASDSYSIGGNWTFDFTGGVSEDLWTTSIAHGLRVDDMIMFTTDGGNPSEYNLREIYYVNSVPSTTTCTLSRSMGGSTLAGSADSASNWAARRLPMLFGTDHWSVSLWVKTTSISSEQYIWSYENNVTLGGKSVSFTASNNTWTCKTLSESNTAHGLSVGDQVIFTESDEEANPSEYKTNIIYYVNAISGTSGAEESFTLSLTPGGSTLGGSDDGSGWIANNNYQKSLFIDSDNGNEIKFSYEQVEMNTNYKIQPNTWTHICVSKGVYKLKDNIVSVYINGELCVRKQIIMNNIYNNPRFILGASHGIGLFFTGQMADVRVYDTYLNAFEIKKLSLNQTQSGPIIHYMCEEGEGTTTKDLGSYGGNLTLLGTTWSSIYKVTGNSSLYFDGTNDYCEANFEGIIGTGTIATCKFTGSDVDSDFETIGHVYSDQSIIFFAYDSSEYKMNKTNITNILSTTSIETTSIEEKYISISELSTYPTSDYLLYSLYNTGTLNSVPYDYDIEECSISRRVKPMTISLWFKKYRDTTTGTLVSFGNQSSEVIKLYIDSSSPYKICARLGNGANIINSSFETNTGAASSDSYANTEWVQVALVILPTREYKQSIQGARIFVNGEDRTIYTPATTRYTSIVNDESSFKFTLGKDNTADLSWSYDETGGTSEDLWTSDKPHGLAVGDTLMFYTAGTNATNYAANTLYYVVSVPSTTSVTLSETSNGSVIAGSTDGSGWESGTNYFKGYMDDIRVYNVALSPNEIKQLYFNTNTYNITKI